MDSNQSEDSCTVETGQCDEYENRPFECKLCGNRFNRSAHLKVHVAVHTGERPFVCELCGDKFTQSSALKTHKLRHTGERPYGCQECNKTFRTSSALKTHSYLHTGETPYSCDVCGKAFKQIGSLKSHSFTHRPEAERPFQCSLCNHGFVTKTLFTIHSLNCEGKRKHYSRFPPLDEDLFIRSGINQYRCSFCKKPFLEKSRLRVHLRSHTGERPYKCELCGRAFSQSGDLKIHVYTHTGERPHQCTMCDKGYTNKGTLGQHMRTHEKRIVTLKKGAKKQMKSSKELKKKGLSSPRMKPCLKSKGRGKKSLTLNFNTKTYNDTSSFSGIENKEDASLDSGHKTNDDSEQGLENESYIVENKDDISLELGQETKIMESGTVSKVDTVDIKVKEGIEMSEVELDFTNEVNYNTELKQETESKSDSTYEISNLGNIQTNVS